jgi:RNA polymerase sigma factor (sigma-70 family)
MDGTGCFDAYRAGRTPDALIALLRASQQTIYNLCYQILRHPQDAEDAAQKVLLEALDALPGIADADHFKNWIYRTCYYVALGLRKARRRRRDHERKKAEAMETDFVPLSEDAAEAVHESVFSLDEDERALVVDHYFERKSLQSLADRTGCSKVAIWKKLEKARDTLKQSLLRKGSVSLAAGLEKFLETSVPVHAPQGLLTKSIAAQAAVVAGGGSLSSVLVVGGIVVKLKMLSVAVVLALSAFIPIGYVARRDRDHERVTTVVPAPAKSDSAGRRETVRLRSAESASPVGVADSAPPEAPDPLFADDEPRGPVGSSIKWFVGTQNRDGSWGQGAATISGHPIDKVGLTGLSLLAFLGAGYSTQSADRFAGAKLGDVVKSGVRFLTQDQAEDGSFKSSKDVIEQALASLALCEAYGMTGSKLLLEPARNSLRALEAAQLKDGSWGDLYQSLWSSYVLTSARLGDLPMDGDRMKQSSDYFRSQLDAGPNLPAMIGWLMVDKDRTHPALAETARWVAVTPPEWIQQDFSYWYMGSVALFVYDGPDGGLWKSWSSRFKQTLIPTQQREGYWAGADPNQTLVQTALGTLSLQVFYRYANAVGSHK